MQEVTAFGRGEFLGTYRLEGMHSLMNKLCQDCKAMMPHESNFDDECSMAKLVALVGKSNKIHNEKKQIVKSDSSFERHSQMFADITDAYGINLYDNYLEMYPNKLAEIKTKHDAEKFIVGMWNE